MKILILSFFLVFAGCMSKIQKAPLSEAVRDYNDSIRWKRHIRAASKVKNTLRDQFMDHMTEMEEDILVHHYEVIRVRFNKPGDQAKVHLKVTWFKDSEGTLHRSHVVQDWKMVGPAWMVDAQHHLRGKDLPTTEALAPMDKQSPMNFDADAKKDVQSRQGGKF